jgi:hypothetical protein
MTTRRRGRRTPANLGAVGGHFRTTRCRLRGRTLDCLASVNGQRDLLVGVRLRDGFMVTARRGLGEDAGFG